MEKQLKKIGVTLKDNEVNTEDTAAKEEALRVDAILFRLAELGGKGLKEEDIVYTGEKLILPTRWTGDLGSAIEYLETKLEEEEENSVFTETYNFRPFDGAFCAFAAMKRVFGMVAGKTTWSFFGPNPPQYVKIAVGPGKFEEVPWGTFTVPLLKDTQITFSSDISKEYGEVFRISVESPRKNRFIIAGLFTAIEEELKTSSIYRGKAIDGQSTPQFIDTRKFDKSKVVYSNLVQTSLDADLWDVLRYSDANREAGLPLKRNILLSGPYGTGKSLAGLRTAVEAVSAGWTFIMVRPGRDDFTNAMKTALLYQPAVVFMEDVDTLASADNVNFVSQMLDLVDGIQSKNTELIVVLTTNHPDKLHKGMMRPGRVDSIIEINALDGAGVEKLIRSVLPNLDKEVDFDPVVTACEGYMPAFVKEVADKSFRYALSRNEGVLDGIVIKTEDLVHSAQALRPQFNRMNDAPEHSSAESLGLSLGNLVRGNVEDVLQPLLPSADELQAGYSWNRNEIRSRDAAPNKKAKAAKA